LILKDDFKTEKFVNKYFSHITLIENFTYLSEYKTTQKILQGSRHEIVYHLLPGNGGMLELYALRKDLEQYLGIKEFVVFKI